MKNDNQKQGMRVVSGTSWGTKRSCPSCAAHFYDLNKMPVSCPKCKHTFDPAAAPRAKRKNARKEEPKRETVMAASVLAPKKPTAKKKEKKSDDEGAAEGGISDIAEMDDVDDIENIRELSELEEREGAVVNEDDADEEAIIEDLDTGGKALVGNVEEEEASALVEEIEDEESAEWKKKKTKKKTK